MKRIFKNIALLAIVLGTSASCGDYLDINNDPDNPTTASATPDLVLAGTQVESFSILPTTANRLGNIMMQSWAGDVTNFTGAFQDEFALNLTTSFYQGIWNSMYVNTATFTFIIENEDPKYSNYNAIARIMKSFYFQYLVDLYGDIPYSEAHKLGEILTPKYDDDQAIYGDLIAQLNTAISLIENPSLDTIDVTSDSDVIFAGDMDMWLKFANTLKLRILLRQEATGIFNDEFASLAGAEFITEDVTINPGYQDASGKLNPFYAIFYNTGGTVTTNRNLYVGAQYAVQFLKGASTEDGISTGVTDPRIASLFELRDGTYTGVQQGENDIPSGNDPSRIGPGLVISGDQDGYIMMAAESYFLQAEAVQKGYLTGSAGDLFRSGVTASFIRLGLSSTSAANYITASENVGKIGWTGSTNKIEAIMTQKWISLMGTNGIESWIEYTRTGYPAVPLSTIAQKPNRPYRLLYPLTEYTGNSANVPEQSSADAFTTHVFWDN